MAKGHLRKMKKEDTVRVRRTSVVHAQRRKKPKGEEVAAQVNK